MKNLDDIIREIEALTRELSEIKTMIKTHEEGHISQQAVRFLQYTRENWKYQRMGDMEWPHLSKDARRLRASRALKKLKLQYPESFNRLK